MKPKVKIHKDLVIIKSGTKEIQVSVEHLFEILNNDMLSKDRIVYASRDKSSYETVLIGMKMI